MATVRHLGIVGGSHGTTHQDPFMVDIPCKNLVVIAHVKFSGGKEHTHTHTHTHIYSFIK